MELTRVNNPKEHKDFLDVARRINQDDPNWICPLDKDIEEVFDPEKNPQFKHGEAERWVLRKDSGELIGRIAAFYDKRELGSELPTGGCGFFECIDDQEAADLLFDQAKEWLQGKGLEGMDGPINFGETDKFWGCLIEGFTPPAYKVAYNQPYFQKLFENYGFKTYYEQEGFVMYLDREIPDRFWKIANWVLRRPGLHFEHFSFKQLDKYVRDFTFVFNEAWKDLKEEFEPLEEDYVRGFIKSAKPIIEEKMIWFAYHEGEPIAIFFMHPDINQLIRPLNGKLNLWNKLRLFYRLKTVKMTRARGVLMGVVPAFQGRGMESGFIYHLEKAFREEMTQYEELEFSWVGDFNPAMRKLWVEVGAEPAKRYITYRKLFDPERPFERHPIRE